jgi:hypothetical protein
MGLDAEFNRGLQLVENTTFSLHTVRKIFTFRHCSIEERQSQNHHVPFFETVIRYLGGLLSAYALSHEPILLAKADQLANLLDPAFETASGLPAYAVSLRTSVKKIYLCLH